MALRPRPPPLEPLLFALVAMDTSSLRLPVITPLTRTLKRPVYRDQPLPSKLSLGMMTAAEDWLILGRVVDPPEDGLTVTDQFGNRRSSSACRVGGRATGA